MTKDDAERLIARLDNLEARARDVEAGMTRIRRELQDAFRVKTWDYDPTVIRQPDPILDPRD
jgi:chaperonin cofactor prefoldin